MPNHNDDDQEYRTDYLEIFNRRFSDFPSWNSYFNDDYRVYEYGGDNIYHSTCISAYDYIKKIINEIWNKKERCFVTLKSNCIEVGPKCYPCKYVEVTGIPKSTGGFSNNYLYGKFNNKNVLIPMEEVQQIIEGGI